MTMERIYRTAPEKAIPKPGVQPYDFLKMLSDFEPIPKIRFFEKFGETMRSPLQSLRGDRFQHWNILECVNHKDEPCYLLDARHGCGSWTQDQIARKERRLKLKRDSRNQAVSETARLPRAEQELHEAVRDMSDVDTEACPSCGKVQLTDDFYRGGCSECGYCPDGKNAQQN